jgi:hypothetical protein
MIACGWWCFGETVEAQTHPFKGRLSNGITMGTSKAQVREKLGSPAKIRVVDEQQAFESWHYPAQGAILSFKLDALSHVAVVPKKADAATSVYIFGPQWEREMRPEDARYLDLDTGQFVAAHPPGDLFHWSAESSLQARAGANMVAIPVQDLKWETADPGELIELVSKAAPQHQVRLGGGKSAILDDPTPGRTWLFKTSEGNTGILQISENSQRSGSVVIRFKLVRRE